MKVWAGDQSVLGAIFVPHFFCDIRQAIVLFWWSDNDPESDKLREAFEAEAALENCERVASCVFGEVNNDLIARLYRRKGYKWSEVVYAKFL
jgi:hypothetical protein